jgi:hypothetical protein
MKYLTTITIWSDIRNTPLTNRGGAYCDELLDFKTVCETPAEAETLTRSLIKLIPHGYSGYYHMPDHPNQNIRNGFVR